MAFILLPAIKDYPQRYELFHKVAVKFRAAAHGALGLLLLTGLANMHFRNISFNPADMADSFDGMMTLKKLVLFIVIVGVSALHDYSVGRKALNDQQAQNGSSNTTTILLARWMARLNLLLGLVAVALGIVIVRGWA